MIEQIVRYIIPASFSLLPKAMRAPEATVMLLATGLQESRFLERRQVGGPARGFWQFETAGVAGVLEHPGTKAAIKGALQILRYPSSPDVVALYEALEHNDVLAATFARCLLYTSFLPLPSSPQHQAEGWELYLATWRPGKPKPCTWDALFAEAWGRVVSPGPDLRTV